MVDDIMRRDNERVLGKMRRGECLTLVSAQSTWYPPRPPTKHPPKRLNTERKNILAFERKKDDTTPKQKVPET